MSENGVKDGKVIIPVEDDFKEKVKGIKIELTSEVLCDVMNNLQTIMFCHKKKADAFLQQIAEKGLHKDTMEVVAHMMDDPKQAYVLIDKLRDLTQIGCVLYVVLKTIKAFLESTRKIHKTYAWLIIDRYFNETIYDTDFEYVLDNNLDQSSFSRKKKRVMKEFTMRFNAEFNSLYNEGYDNDLFLQKNEQYESKYCTARNYLFANIDTTDYSKMINRSIFKD